MVPRSSKTPTSSYRLGVDIAKSAVERLRQRIHG